jgi:serine/threonine-protein kinase
MLGAMEFGGASDRELEPGDTLGPYRLESVLGEGGMGLVFKAHRDGDDRPVALKVLKRQLSGDFIFQQRFKQEARAAAEVHDRHLVAILESSESDGRHYIASDYVDGGSLTDRVAADGPLPVADVVRVVTEVATGLDALHEAGVMHRRHQAVERPDSDGRPCSPTSAPRKDGRTPSSPAPGRRVKT